MLLENVRIVLQIGIFRNRYFQLNSMYHLLPGKELHSFMLMVIFISRTFSREKKKNVFHCMWEVKEYRLYVYVCIFPSNKEIHIN